MRLSTEHGPPSSTEAGSQNLTLHIDVLTTDDWEQMGSAGVCTRCSQDALLVQFPSKGGWGAWVQGAVPGGRSARPSLSHFAVKDCALGQSDTLGEESLSIAFETHMTQADGSELSVEAQGVLIWNELALQFMIVLLVLFYEQARGIFRSVGFMHPVLYVLLALMMTQLAGHITQTLHLRFYQYFGVDVYFAEVSTNVLWVAGEVGKCGLLIAIALGYTLLTPKLSGSGLEAVVPLTQACASIHIVLLAFRNHRDDETLYGREGLRGCVILAIRLLAYAIFLAGIRSSKAYAGPRVGAFLYKLQLAGSVYFLALPLIVCFVGWFPLYHQHKAKQVGQIFVQLASNVWLGNVFLYKGEYTKLSSVHNANLLYDSDAPQSEEMRAFGRT